MEGLRTPVARDGRRAADTGWKHPLLPAWSLLVLGVCLTTCLLPLPSGAAPEAERDFPPLSEPGRPVPHATTPSAPATPGKPGTAPATSPATSPDETPVTEPEPYLLCVGDEVSVAVLAEPELSRTVKVRPDGALTTPGAGTIHALGRTPEEVGREIEGKLGEFLRHPHVDLVVTNYGEQRIFVMGEVLLPGDKPYHRGVSAMQAIALCGGFNDRGSRKSVLVLRRTGRDDVEIRRLDLNAALEGEGGASDILLRPYDIVYVPKTWIANVDTFFDQYFKQTLSAFSFYIEGWKAIQITTDNVKWVAGP